MYDAIIGTLFWFAAGFILFTVGEGDPSSALIAGLVFGGIGFFLAGLFRATRSTFIFLVLWLGPFIIIGLIAIAI